jgi:predicted RNA binding protein YcfA (HicA-like mRNA interferase family)
MKRRDLIRHLERHDCYLDREGGRHSIYRNPQNGRAVLSRGIEKLKRPQLVSSVNRLEFPARSEKSWVWFTTHTTC